MRKDILNSVYKYVLTIVAFGLQVLYLDSDDWYLKVGVAALFIFLFGLISYYEVKGTYNGSFIYSMSICGRIVGFIFILDIFLYILDTFVSPIENLAEIRTRLVSSTFMWTVFMAIFYRLFVVRKSIKALIDKHSVGKNNSLLYLNAMLFLAVFILLICKELAAIKYVFLIYLILLLPFILFDSCGSFKEAFIVLIIILSKAIYAYGIIWAISLSALYFFNQEIDYIHALYYPFELAFKAIMALIGIMMLGGLGGGGSSSSKSSSSSSSSASSSSSEDMWTQIDREVEEDIEIEDD